MDMNNYHTSVLLQEVIDNLDIKSGKKYIDATLGGGGHTREILKKGGDVLGIDVDGDAHMYVESKNEKSSSLKGTLTRAVGNFERIDELAKANSYENVDGIVFDLGVSGHQFDTAERGFSFKSGPLDMRMSKALGVTAADLINGLTRNELVILFEKFGEEPFAKKIASAITGRRHIRLFHTTDDLADVIKRTVTHSGATHPATRVFQALRIAVNDEMNVLKSALPKALELLNSQGKIVVITFHSLEDRIVKRQFEEWQEKEFGKIITKKPITPTKEELQRNSRSRSAKLRVFEKK